MDFLIHHYFDPIFEAHYITTSKYIDPEACKKRCYTLVKWAYSIIYYLLSSAWAYKIMLGCEMFPTWLGGNGSVHNMFKGYPDVTDYTLEMKVFYLLQAGKHMSRFFSHVFIRPEGNFFEYALHHCLSLFLIMFSYLTNQWVIGVFVLLLHDYSDFALIIARMYKVRLPRLRTTATTLSVCWISSTCTPTFHGWVVATCCSVIVAFTHHLWVC